jgi:hypothetical protein
MIITTYGMLSSEEEQTYETTERITKAMPLLDDISLQSGIYESDDIERILSFPRKAFNKEDLIVFDIDEVAITAFDAYHAAHASKNTPSHRKLLDQPQLNIDRFFLYMFLSKTWGLMDKRFPGLVRNLQVQGIKCIANTTFNPTVNAFYKIDTASMRLHILREFGIDFSQSFPYLPIWDFNNLEPHHSGENKPLYKDGIIFSADTPKLVTLDALLERLPFKPKRIVYIDDKLENAQRIYEGLTSIDIECYSFVYTKAEKEPIHAFFSEEAIEKSLENMEAFLSKLLEGSNVDIFFQSSRYRDFILT